MRLMRVYARSLNLAARLGRGIEGIVVPNGCAFCGSDLPHRMPPVCDGCHQDMPWVEPRFHLDLFAMAVTPLEYAFPIDAAIKRLKFDRKLFYVPAFCHLLEQVIYDLPEDIDAVLPMPLHWRRQASRGFNQALEIAKGIRKMTGLPVIDVVRRRRHTPFQSGLTALQRKRNLKQAFATRGVLECNHALLVDDVITTGESCRELARIVLGAGVEKVSAIAIARAMRG